MKKDEEQDSGVKREGSRTAAPAAAANDDKNGNTSKPLSPAGTLPGTIPGTATSFKKTKIQFALNPKKRRKPSDVNSPGVEQGGGVVGGLAGPTHKRHNASNSNTNNVLSDATAVEEEELKTRKTWNLSSLTTTDVNANANATKEALAHITMTNNATEGPATSGASFSFPNSYSSGGSSGFSSGDSFGSEEEEPIFALETNLKEGNPHPNPTSSSVGQRSQPQTDLSTAALTAAVNDEAVRDVVLPVRVPLATEREGIDSIAEPTGREQNMQQNVLQTEDSISLHTPNQPLTQDISSPSNINPTQLQGWRVKLYLLNSDGSWKDCGTGRIAVLVSSKKSISAENNQNRIEPSRHEGKNSFLERKRDSMEALEEEIYQELGEPTLFMHAEAQQPPPPQGTTGSPSSLVVSPPKVLLRTRVLFRDEYQRQGDNIITWCAPLLPASLEQEEGAGNDTKEKEQYLAVRAQFLLHFLSFEKIDMSII